MQHSKPNTQQEINEYAEQSGVYIKKNHEKISYSNEEIIANIQAGIKVKHFKDLLVRKNRGLVMDMAYRCTYHIPYEDKVQYCYEGLLHAAAMFNPDAGTKFTTYAYTTIRNHVYRSGMSDNNLIAIPSYLSEFSIVVNRFCDDYYQKYRKEPTIEIITRNTGVPEQHVKNIRVFKRTFVAYDTSTSDDEELSLDQIITSEDKQFNLTIDSLMLDDLEIVDSVVKTFSSFEQEIINKFYGINGVEKKTLDEMISDGIYDVAGVKINSITTLHRRINKVIDNLKLQCMKKQGTKA